MSYAQALEIKEAIEKVLEEYPVRKKVFIRIEGTDIQIYEEVEDIPEVELEYL